MKRNIEMGLKLDNEIELKGNRKIKLNKTLNGIDNIDMKLKN